MEQPRAGRRRVTLARSGPLEGHGTAKGGPPEGHVQPERSCAARSGPMEVMEQPRAGRRRPSPSASNQARGVPLEGHGYLNASLEGRHRSRAVRWRDMGQWHAKGSTLEG